MRKNLKIWRPDLCNISDNAEIGDDVVIHAFVNVYDETFIGDRCHLESGVFIPNLVTLEEDTFVGPNCTFLNDSRPPSHGKYWKKTIVHKGAVIGGNCTVLPGIEIGENAMIGAGSVVTKNIPPNEVWMGNPAKFYKKREDL